MPPGGITPICSLCSDGWSLTLSPALCVATNLRSCTLHTHTHTHTGIIIYTVNHKKRATLFSIITPALLARFFFIIFVPVETGRNTLQLTYLMAWWRYNSVLMQIAKVYLIQLVLKIKYVEFEDKPNNFYLKKWECDSFSARRLIKELSTKKMKNTNIGRHCAKVASNWFDRTHWDDWLKMCCLYAVLVFPGSVETQLGWSGKFY